MLCGAAAYGARDEVVRLDEERRDVTALTQRLESRLGLPATSRQIDSVVDFDIFSSKKKHQFSVSVH